MRNNSQVDSSVYASIIFGKTPRNKCSGYIAIDPFHINGDGAAWKPVAALGALSLSTKVASRFFVVLSETNILQGMMLS
jgi:hypothetical protein